MPLFGLRELWRKFACEGCRLIFCLLILTTVQLTAGLTCLSCPSVERPSDCLSTVTCHNHQSCFARAIETNSDVILWELGCRDSSNCSSMVTKRDSHPRDSLKRKAGETLCDECCSTNLCNAGLCGEPPLVPQSDRGPVCYSCQEKSPGSCQNIKICGRNQVCRLKRIRPNVYNASCSDRLICDSEMGDFSILIGRKRSAYSKEISVGGTCFQECCDEDLCNGECGSQSFLVPTPPPATKVTTTVPLDACLSNPCIHGNCSQYLYTYRCQCRTGAHGRNCELFEDPCLSNPCTFGTCITAGTSFACDCNPGYTGTLCNKVSDPCQSNPCRHGNCSSTGSGFTCRCDIGYRGTTCDTAVSDPCLLNPCTNGFCASTGPGYTCTCNHGYTGRHCDTKDPCLHGRYQTTGMSFACLCDPGYTGRLCDSVINPCMPDPCGNGTCLASGLGYTCFCDPGYKGTNCSQFDPCLLRPCQNGVCYPPASNTPGSSFRCLCFPGYSGTNCQHGIKL